ncbi:dematin isoform X4 [Passer montanus]|uniref:dematin isoform X4 n=1 Tax=Passer montanus TaxID=9160 RepID=UPI00195F84F2|nr:dematin isoform X4 [Passer montanus]
MQGGGQAGLAPGPPPAPSGPPTASHCPVRCDPPRLPPGAVLGCPGPHTGSPMLGVPWGRTQDWQNRGGFWGAGAPPNPRRSPEGAARSHIRSGSLRVRDEQANPALIPDYEPREARPERAAGWPSGQGGGQGAPRHPRQFWGSAHVSPLSAGLGSPGRAGGQRRWPGFRGWEDPRRWKCLLHLHPPRDGAGGLLLPPHPGKLRHGASPCPRQLHASHGKSPGAGSWWLLRPPRCPGAIDRHGLAAAGMAAAQTGQRRNRTPAGRGSGTRELPVARRCRDQVAGGAPRVAVPRFPRGNTRARRRRPEGCGATEAAEPVTDTARPAPAEWKDCRSL